MSTATESPDTARRVEPIYTFLEGELMINAPLERVWPHVLNYTKWQKYAEVRHVSGPKGQEGEVNYLVKDEPGYKTTPYYARMLRLEPNRRVTWKTFRDNSDYFGIVEFRVDTVGEQTRFSWRMMYEHVFPYSSEAELEQIKKNHRDNFSTLERNIFPNLKVLVERGE